MRWSRHPRRDYRAYAAIIPDRSLDSLHHRICVASWARFLPGRRFSGSRQAADLPHPGDRNRAPRVRARRGGAGFSAFLFDMIVLWAGMVAGCAYSDAAFHPDLLPGALTMFALSVILGALVSWLVRRCAVPVRPCVASEASYPIHRPATSSMDCDCARISRSRPSD